MMVFRGWIVCSLLMLLASCSRYPFPNEHDPYNGKTRQDYEEILAKPTTPKKVASAKVKPMPAPLLPPTIHSKFYKKITVQISEEVPLKDVLLTLAKQAGIDLEMAGAPDVGVSFSAKDTPFIDVIKRITSLIKWRYHLDGTCLRLEPDVPFLKTITYSFYHCAAKVKTMFP